jgi:uncharacterized membrane protein
MQQDVEFGLVQLTDIAVRALSPGVNDPTTAGDITVHIGNVLVSIWEQDEPPSEVRIDGRTIVMVRPTHGGCLQRTIGPIRRYGADDPDVMATVARTLLTLRSEAVRRDLPGPLEPIAAELRSTRDSAETARWTADERGRFAALVD